MFLAAAASRKTHFNMILAPASLAVLLWLAAYGVARSVACRPATAVRPPGAQPPWTTRHPPPGTLQ